MEMTICRQDQPYEIMVPSQQYRSYSSMGGGDGGSPPRTLEETDEEMVRIAIDRVAVDSDSNPSCSLTQMTGMSSHS